jgi:hypothetical protein
LIVQLDQSSAFASERKEGTRNFLCLLFEQHPLVLERMVLKRTISICHAEPELRRRSQSATYHTYTLVSERTGLKRDLLHGYNGAAGEDLPRNNLRKRMQKASHVIVKRSRPASWAEPEYMDLQSPEATAVARWQGCDIKVASQTNKGT